MQGIANLERDGLLTRSPHPQHGRILTSALTERGSQVLGRARQCVHDVKRLIADAIGPRYTSDFADMLSRCADRLAAE
jgi:DNA-binding MarR family transcriptional regulator